MTQKLLPFLHDRSGGGGGGDRGPGVGEVEGVGHVASLIRFHSSQEWLKTLGGDNRTNNKIYAPSPKTRG